MSLSHESRKTEFYFTKHTKTHSRLESWSSPAIEVVHQPGAFEPGKVFIGKSTSQVGMEINITKTKNLLSRITFAT